MHAIGAVLDAAVRASHGFELQADPAFLADPRPLAFVALDGETVVGFAWGFELPRPTGGTSDLLCGSRSRRPSAITAWARSC